MVYGCDRVLPTPQSVTLGHESYGRLSCETATMMQNTHQANIPVPVPLSKPRRRSTPATGNLQPSDLVGLTREERRRRRRATLKVNGMMSLSFTHIT